MILPKYIMLMLYLGHIAQPYVHSGISAVKSISALPEHIRNCMWIISETSAETGAELASNVQCADFSLSKQMHI